VVGDTLGHEILCGVPMQKLQDIGIRTERPDDMPTSHGNAVPLLHEILYALQRLSTERETTTFDLQAIPFGPGDEAQLFGRLGRGEVTVRLQALGESEIWETAYPGVWILEHRNILGERISLHIEVTRIPAILQTQWEDLTESIQRLDRELQKAARSPDMTDPGGPDGREY
jgi:hydrogenase-1 operon protein HyaF